MHSDRQVAIWPPHRRKLHGFGLDMCEVTLNTVQSVACVLLTRGRLPIGQIIRFTQLKPRTVRAAIIILVQHNLLWHAQSDDEGAVFEMNTEECRMRLRYGRYVWLAEQLFGKAVRHSCSRDESAHIE